METSCPACGSRERQNKAGMHAGRQRIKCGVCQRRYTQGLPMRGYADEVRRTALSLYDQGYTMREIARRLGVNHQSVANWIHSRANLEPEAGEDVGEAAPTAVAVPSPVLTMPLPAALKQRPTISDVARQAGVSTSSVSNYLNGKGRMGEATRQRIKEAMEALHFTPSALVQAIRRRRTNILGVVLYGMSNLDERDERIGASLTTGLLRGIHDAADEADNDLLLYTGWPVRNRPELGLRFLDGHIDGLIWVNPGMGGPDWGTNNPILERVAAARLPVMTLLTRHVPEGVGFVNADNIGAMETVVSHLVERGHRRIAFIGPGHLSNALDRQEGYRRGLEARGLTWDPALQVQIAGRGWLRKSGREELAVILETWLALPSPPTAIMCANDSLAATFVQTIQARGLRIPDDIALTGFDDMPMAEHIAGGLTTVRQPFRKMGRLATESVLDLIAGKPPENYRLTVPAELVLRASTALPRISAIFAG